jgi:hypothetical protein
MFCLSYISLEAKPKIAQRRFRTNRGFDVCINKIEEKSKSPEQPDNMVQQYLDRPPIP